MCASVSASLHPISVNGDGERSWHGGGAEVVAAEYDTVGVLGHSCRHWERFDAALEGAGVGGRVV